MVLNRYRLTAIFTLGAALLLTVLWQWSITPATSASTIDDSYVTSATFSSSSTTLGATGVTYTVGFVLSQSVTSDQGINIDIMSSSGCGEDWEACQVDVSNATVSGVAATASISSRNVYLTPTSTLAAGSYTLTIANATNPTDAAALRAYVSTGASDEEDLLGDDYSSDHWYSTASSSVVNMGTALVSGTVTAGGSAAADVWVQLYNSDWSKSRGASVDSEGYYAIFADHDDAGYWTNGSYTMTAYASEGSGYISTSQDITYSGSALSQDITLSAATYFFAGSVVYSDEASTTVSVQAGTPVTNANVCFWSNSAGSFCDTTDENGEYSVAVEAGEYYGYVSANIDWSDPDQVATVDWRYQSDDETYSITAEGTEQVNFEVDPTTALLSGSVTIPNSSELIDGSINLTNEDDNYWGSISDGSYVLNLNPGTYTLTFSPDTNQNSAWGQYSYSGTVTVEEGDNTHDFTVETLSSSIHFTVSNQSGDALEGVNVNAWSSEHWSGSETDSAGEATVYVMSDTWYEVGVWDENYLSVEPTQRVEVGTDSTVDVTFTMQQANATIMATILDSDGNVVDDLRGWFGCHTDDYSHHYGEDLHNGTVEVGVIVDPDTGEFDGQCSAWLQDEEDGAVTPQDVLVAEGETATLEFSLLPLDATIKAVVKNFATGKKIDADSNVEVNLWNQSDDMSHWRRLEENPIEIDVVANKSYTGGIWSQDPRYIPLWSMNSDAVKVPSGETETLVLNVLEQDGTVHITAKDPNGDPVPYGWAWCGNWQEVDFALDTVAENTVIDSGAQIRDGAADVPLVAGHSYRCGVGAGEEFVEDGWLSPPEQEVEFTSSSDALETLTFKFKEADATLTGSIKDSDTYDSAWCWAWSEGGSSWTQVDPDEDYRLNLSTDNGDWVAGCDAVQGEDWYFTEQPYEFTPDKGKNTHNFKLEKMAAWKVYDAVNETFDATENKVITYGDGTRLTIPSGTLATEGDVTVRGTPETNIARTSDNPLMIPVDWEAFDSSGNLIETFPGGTVTIEIPYSDDALAELGIEEDSLIGKYWDELSGTWKQPDNVSIDKDNNIVTVTTDHFTQYGVTYNARVSNVRKPNMPKVTVKSSGKHNVKLALRTKKTSPKATRFVVQVRKYGVTSKSNWTTKKFSNAKKKARLVRSVQKLLRNKNYEVRAKACNSAGCSQQTDWQSFKTE